MVVVAILQRLRRRRVRGVTCSVHTICMCACTCAQRDMYVCTCGGAECAEGLLRKLERRAMLEAGGEREACEVFTPILQVI